MEPTPLYQGLTFYEKYIRTQELLALQKPRAEQANHDELCFQVTHQAAELWMKVCHQELEENVRRMDADRLAEAAHGFHRCTEALKVCCAGLVVLETMSPLNYHGVRVTLGRGSGQDSPGFNRILDCGPWVWAPFARVLERGKKALIDIHRKPSEHWDLFRLVEEMMAFDEEFQRFRYSHFSLVRRIIGADVKSLKGIPASTLSKGTTEPLFKELWDVINVLTRETSDVYGGH